MYEIVDKTTKQVVGRAKTLKGAHRSVDRRDNAYGCYQFFVRKVEDAIPMANMRDLDRVMGW